MTKHQNLKKTNGDLRTYVADILKAFDKHKNKGTEIDQMRAGLILSMGITWHLIDEVCTDTETPAAKAFSTLALALVDLRHGILHPLLRHPVIHPVPDRQDIWMVRALAAIGVQYLIESGMTRPAAATTTAKHFPRLGLALRQRAQLQSSILRWRDDFCGKKVKNKIAKAYFEEVGMAELKEIQPAASPADLKRNGMLILAMAENKAKDLAP